MTKKLPYIIIAIIIGFCIFGIVIISWNEIEKESPYEITLNSKNYTETETSGFQDETCEKVILSKKAVGKETKIHYRYTYRDGKQYRTPYTVTKRAYEVRYKVETYRNSYNTFYKVEIQTEKYGKQVIYTDAQLPEGTSLIFKQNNVSDSENKYNVYTSYSKFLKNRELLLSEVYSYRTY